ncbi:hypothetical protein LINPERHAP1_LOCUS41942 [Linum perenne]
MTTVVRKKSTSQSLTAEALSSPVEGRFSLGSR